MLSKNQAKKIQQLHLKKNRSEQGIFIAEGPKLAQEILGSEVRVLEIYGTKEWLQDFSNEKRTAITEISEEELKKISTLSTPNQVMLICETPVHRLDLARMQNELTLYLDDIRDPGNLGTIIRVADWFGVKQVICSPGTTEIYGPKTIQSSMGSVTRVKAISLDFTELLADMKENKIAIPVYGALLSGENIYTREKLLPGLLVIGNESNGISEKVISGLTDRIKIPASSKNGAESLNAAVATSLVIAEFFRRSEYC